MLRKVPKSRESEISYGDDLSPNPGICYLVQSHSEVLNFASVHIRISSLEENPRLQNTMQYRGRVDIIAAYNARKSDALLAAICFGSNLCGADRAQPLSRTKMRDK